MTTEEIQQTKQKYGIIGGNDQLNHAINVALQVAPIDISVLILGESGVGKEIFSHIIHDNSPRKNKKLLAVNCGAIPEGTIDSELFGHVKGSFTNALSDRKGLFEEADGGTIFLDEIGEMPLSTQARLLRILETGEFLRVGSSSVQRTDVRIVAATNVNLNEAIRAKRFREDLYYRLAVVPIRIPPLRERKQDIPRLFRRFAEEFSEKWRIPKITLLPDAVELLTQCYWRGNIRELKNFVEKISVILPEREIDGETLRQYLPDEGNVSLPAISVSSNHNGNNDNERELLVKMFWDMSKQIQSLQEKIQELSGDQPITVTTHDNVEITKPSSTPISGQRNDITDIEEYVDERFSLPDIERDSIIKALRKHNNNRRKAAEELGISSRTIYRKISQYNIDL
ncbi:MAG: sigma-54-dependent Fis family transcriptional regulator [bacterium]|nr:sigma-54-dependent Fis family transcriptional regulator [Candidatus Minthenecus merdequi]